MVLLNSDRALALMRQSDIDAMVATSPRNVLYLSDYYCWLDPLFKAYMMRPGAPAELSHNFAVLAANADVALVVPGIWAASALESWVEDLWLHSVSDLDLSAVPAVLQPKLADLLRRVQAGRTRTNAIQALRDLLRARGLADARIGIELEGLSATERQALADALPGADIRDCSNLLCVIRMVKSVEEVRRLERATRIAYQAAMASLGAARVGTPLGQVRQHYVSEIAGAGAQLDHFIASPRGLGIEQDPDYCLEDGDVLYVDYGCVYEHYYSDNGTTLMVGRFDAEFARRYEVLRAGLEAGVAQLRPGVAASEARRAMIDTLAEGGITGSNAHGHGIGLEVRDYPIIVPDTGLRIRDDCIDLPSDVPFEAGMATSALTRLALSSSVTTCSMSSQSPIASWSCAVDASPACETNRRPRQMRSSN